MNWNRIAALACLSLVACSQPAPQMSLSSQKEIATEYEVDAATQARRNYKPVKWPLKFKKHTFSASCYDTMSCFVWYARVRHGNNKPSPPSSKYGPGYLDNWLSGHVGIHNFPDPAEVRWRSKDGTEHTAYIDIAAIFRDELVLHNVPRKEIPDLPDGKYQFDPSILLEVNDRTIRVYMGARVPTRHLQIPGNPYSDGRAELILAKTYNY